MTLGRPVCRPLLNCYTPNLSCNLSKYVKLVEKTPDKGSLAKTLCGLAHLAGAVSPTRALLSIITIQQFCCSRTVSLHLNLEKTQKNEGCSFSAKPTRKIRAGAAKYLAVLLLLNIYV